jgi:hypothetical protein
MTCNVRAGRRSTRDVAALDAPVPVAQEAPQGESRAWGLDMES